MLHMDNYAIIKIAGNQHFVTLDSDINVNKLNYPEGKEIEIPEVLLYKNNGKVEIGTPTVKIPVKAKILKHYKGEKTEVIKYKAKVRYRRHIGFRPQLTQIKITQIGEIKNTDSENKQLVSVNKINVPAKKITIKKTEEKLKTHPK